MKSHRLSQAARHRRKHAPVVVPTATGEAAPQTGGSALVPVKPHAPITAKTPRLHYTGPVYELDLTGQVTPYVPAATQEALDEGTGGSVVSTVAPTKPRLEVPGKLARLVDGLAAAPMEAPEAVKDIIWAGDEIVGLPYIYGGGHASWHSPGYDCSGTVSYALHGADLLTAPEDSSELEGFGGHGIGRMGDRLREPRARVHGRRRAAPRHERRRRPLQPAGPALATAAPVERRLHRPASRSTSSAPATSRFARRVRSARAGSALRGARGRSATLALPPPS